MYLYFIIGRPDEGKSYFIKQYLKTNKNSPCLVFDVENEYKFLTSDKSQRRSRDIDLDMKKFIEICEKKTYTICVFEESTGYFRGNVGDKLVKLIQRRKHTKNTFLFVFHSIHSIPPAIIDFASYVVLFKTNDNLVQVKQKFPFLIPYYLKLQNKPLHSKLIISVN